MKHVLNVVLVATTVSAMASIEKIDIDSLNIDNIDEESLSEVVALIEAPIVKNVIHASFVDLVNNLHQEDKSLVDIYASVSSDGNNTILTDLKKLKTGTQNTAGGAGFPDKSGLEYGDYVPVPPPPPPPCHSNHSSRGWR